MSSRSAQIYSLLHERFDRSKAPLLYDQLEEFKVSKPFTGLSVLHNVPITLTTLMKLEPLIEGGADLTVTLPLFVNSNEDALRYLDEMAAEGLIKVVKGQNDLVEGQYDIVLDCCAELAHLKPRIGIVEITQTGGNLYKAKALECPVINVDDSHTKRLEDALGSADGFMRALAKWVPNQVFEGNHFVVFGFGKVGVGIAERLKQVGGIVTVVDTMNDKAAFAQKLGHTFLHSQEKDRIHDAVSKAQIIVTATGCLGIISANYDKQPFEGKVLVNIGTHDEWGNKFTESEVLFGKKPVNFSLEEPTTIEYLDPAFVAHNIGGMQLATRKITEHRVHPLDKEIDNKILNRWCAHHQRQPPTFYQCE